MKNYQFPEITIQSIQTKCKNIREQQVSFLNWFRAYNVTGKNTMSAMEYDPGTHLAEFNPWTSR